MGQRRGGGITPKSPLWCATATHQLYKGRKTFGGLKAPFTESGCVLFSPFSRRNISPSMVFSVFWSKSKKNKIPISDFWQTDRFMIFKATISFNKGRCPFFQKRAMPSLRFYQKHQLLLQPTLLWFFYFFLRISGKKNREKEKKNQRRRRRKRNNPIIK